VPPDTPRWSKTATGSAYRILTAREIHEGVDRRQLTLLHQAAEKCLGRRAILGRVDAGPAEDPTPRRQRRELAHWRVAKPPAGAIASALKASAGAGWDHLPRQSLG